MARWLVTGASGLLGVNLASNAVALGHHTIACYGRQAVDVQGAECVPLTLTDPAAVEKLIAAHRPVVVVHCAAETRVDHCEDHPGEARMVNVDGTRSVTQAAARVGATLVYISTDSVFDGQEGQYDEDGKPAPLNIYARTKLEGEGIVREGASDHLIVRTNIFGWNAQPRLSLAEWMLDRLEKGMTVPGFTDVTFSPLLVNHLADVIFHAVSRGLRGTYHMGAGDWTTKFEFARSLCRIFEFDQRLIVPSVSSGAGLKAMRPRNTSLNSTRIARALTKDMPMIQDGLVAFRRLRDSGYHARLRSTLRVLS